jgi:RNA polymerase sigma factor (sigma-70 family)
MDKIYKIFLKNQPFIKTLARKYSKIDPAVNEEDLFSEGYIAVVNAACSFNPQKGLTFSSYLWWHLQKRFQSVLGTDKIVEVKYKNGKKEVLAYREFLRIKRTLPEGTDWRVTSLLSSFEELVGEKKE